jgi:N-acylneuraminate cytidylyltransferase
VVEEYGCDVPFRRPVELAQDDMPSIDALLRAVDQMPDHDYVVLLQPTSPLRTAEDIDAVVERCHQTKAPACVIATETDKLPQRMYTLSYEHRLEPVLDSDEAGYPPAGSAKQPTCSAEPCTWRRRTGYERRGVS